MLNTFFISYRIKNTCRTNGIIYALKSLPLIKKLLPDSLYASRALKIIASIISGVGEFFSIFLGRSIYVALLFFLASAMSAPTAETFLHSFLFLSAAGGVINTQLFSPTKDKYYAIVLMRMDARLYTLSDFFYNICKVIVGMLPAAIVFGTLAGLPFAVCAALPFCAAGIKLCAGALALCGYDGSGEIKHKFTPLARLAVCAVLLGCAYIPPALGFALSETGFYAAAAAAVVYGGVSLVILLRFGRFRAIYKNLLSPESFAANADSQAIVQKSFEERIIADTGITSSKTGWKYFNELFIKRHAKLLTRSAKRIAVIFAFCAAAAALACFAFPQVRGSINSLMLTNLPLFLWIMYFTNRGQVITRAMFMNCDHSMLSYRFYRQPNAVLALFTQRLKYTVLINLVPAAVIAVALPLLLYVSGGTDSFFYYPLLFVSVLAMSVFFSVHSLVMYYLLQPYNIELQSKNPLYGIISGATYFVCYMFMRAEISTVYFGVGITVFCVVYAFAALLLAYRLAPKTFKLRT